MKKILMVILVITVATVMVYSECIMMGDFPQGKWLDANWNAVWEFTSNNIRILDTDGGVYCDFDEKTIRGWSVKPVTEGFVLSFYCPETRRKYIFTKSLANMNLILVIDPGTVNHYKVELPFQK